MVFVVVAIILLVIVFATNGSSSEAMTKRGASKPPPLPLQPQTSPRRLASRQKFSAISLQPLLLFHAHHLHRKRYIRRVLFTLIGISILPELMPPIIRPTGLPAGPQSSNATITDVRLRAVLLSANSTFITSFQSTKEDRTASTIWFACV